MQFMIDYEKLKLAHELADKCGAQIHYAYTNSEGTHVHWVGLDQLFFEMQELMQPNPKYEVGQEVWYTDYHNSKGPIIYENITEITLCNALWGEKEYRIKTQSKDLPERLFYPSREALIEAQITYWHNQLQEELEQPIPHFEGEIQGFNHSEDKLEKVCEHLGQYYGSIYRRQKVKCIKCEEFF